MATLVILDAQSIYSSGLSSQENVTYRSFGRKYYFWRIRELALCWHYNQKYGYHKYADCINFKRLNFLDEIRLWDKHYLPRSKLSRDALILDAGSGESENLFFLQDMASETSSQLKLMMRCSLERLKWDEDLEFHYAPDAARSH